MLLENHALRLLPTRDYGYQLEARDVCSSLRVPEGRVNDQQVQHLTEGFMGLVEEPGISVRTVMGEGKGLVSPIKMRLLDIRIDEGKQYKEELIVDEFPFIYVVSGCMRLEDEKLEEGSLALLDPGRGKLEAEMVEDTATIFLSIEKQS